MLGGCFCTKIMAIRAVLGKIQQCGSNSKVPGCGASGRDLLEEKSR